ncbi:unnamed protein product, partial [marine sediment metagenome]
KKEEEKENEKTSKPPNMQEAILDDELETAPYKTNKDIPKHLHYLPEGAKDVFRKTFNKGLPKGEDYAFPVAYTAMKRWLKKNGYKKNNKGKWVKDK